MRVKSRTNSDASERLNKNTTTVFQDGPSSSHNTAAPSQNSPGTTSPYSLIPPFAFKPPAAVMTTPTAGGKPNTAAKRKQPSKKDEKIHEGGGGGGAANANANAASRNVKPKFNSSQPILVLPFKQISILGLAPIPPLVFAQRDDVIALCTQRLFAEKKLERARKNEKEMRNTFPNGDARARGPPPTKGTPHTTAAAARQPLHSKTSVKATTSALKPPRYPKRGPAGSDLSSDLDIGGGGDDADTDTAQFSSPEWHPGMHSSYGMTFINPMIVAAANTAYHPPPPIFSGTPSRYQQMPLTTSDLPQFNEDDAVLASLEYLKYLASAVGHLPSYPSRLQQGFNVEQRLYRERLARILMAKVGRHTEKPRPGGTRRSTRTRTAPDVFIPTAGQGRGGGGRDYSSDDDGFIIEPYDPADATDVRLGSDFQADVPAQQRRATSATPPPQEARWIANLVLKSRSTSSAAATAPSARLRSPPRLETATRSFEDQRHAAAILAATAKLKKAVGTAAATHFGLGTMGAVMAADLTPEQQQQLYDGMKKHGRDFHSISKKFMNGEVPPRRLAAYYYDIWKLRAVPVARQWYGDRTAEEAARAAEEAAAERQRVEDAARKAERAEASNRRRLVKEAIHWMRASAKCTAVNFHKPIVRERVSRIHKACRIGGGGGASSPVVAPVVAPPLPSTS